MTKKPIIKCPSCGAEYIPAEIYYPDKFFGKLYNLIKDENGAILNSDIEKVSLNPSETYICDKCGKEFSVEATVTFKTELVKDLFTDDFEG